MTANNDQGYAATLEGFIARFDDIAVKLRDALNGDDFMELSDLIEEFLEELERAARFITDKKGRMF